MSKNEPLKLPAIIKTTFLRKIMICAIMNSLLRLLGTVLADKILPEEKEEILQNEYGIEMLIPSKEGYNLMCNLSDLIEERGIEQGRTAERISKIQKMIQKNYSKEAILDLDYTEEEYAKAEAELKKIL